LCGSPPPTNTPPLPPPPPPPPLRADWEAVKDDVMRKAVLRKFERHAALRAVLLDTGDEEIIENSPIDPYWGCGADGLGLNMLGKILMETRTALREGAAETDASK
jgi:N-glycosidase YbiA